MGKGKVREGWDKSESDRREGRASGCAKGGLGRIFGKNSFLERVVLIPVEGLNIHVDVEFGDMDMGWPWQPMDQRDVIP